ncbi:glycosyltransferase [Arhodomonas sp. SL1]|uniref:glycosyltransferase n=1 Tax=Arhodomonas sp. SL1 TaxID=3425691 RepID=UPI003F883B6B
MMETVDDSGWRGLLKRIGYGHLFRQWRQRLEGVLATGAITPDWVAARGMPADRVFPFAYFLPDDWTTEMPDDAEDRPFRFLFVGQIIERKRLHLLIDALSMLRKRDFEFVVVGDGPLTTEMRTRAEKGLGGRVRWIGPVPMDEVKAHMRTADCLVLPSRRDGWGAVVVEALMAGTPTVCSDGCGAAEAVLWSGCGGVFRSGDSQDLTRLLQDVMTAGRMSTEQRAALADWARCLGAAAGAKYLESILAHSEDQCERPLPPWRPSDHEVGYTVTTHAAGPLE